MKLRNTAQSLAVLSAVCLLPSCGLFGSGAPRLATVDDLVTQIERVHIESELAKEKTQVAIDALRSLVDGDYGEHGDAVQSYEKFSSAIEQSESQSVVLEQSVAGMKTASGPVFEQWTEDLDAYTNESMRRRSEARLSDTRGRYEAIVAAVDPALRACQSFNSGLRDHALFLGHDFNTAAVAAIKDDTRSLMSLAGELDVRFDACLAAARSYFETRRMPAGPANQEIAPRAGGRSTAQPPAGR